MDDCFGDELIAMRIEKDRLALREKIFKTMRECRNQGIDCNVFMHTDMPLYELQSIYREMPKPLGVH